MDNLKNSEQYILFISKNFKQSRDKIIDIEKSEEYEILKKAYRADKWEIKAKSKSGKIINFLAIPAGYPNYLEVINKTLSRVGAQAVVYYEETIL
jgi:hypothetical protein